MARAKDRAYDDHRKELEACDELITLLKEKLRKVSAVETHRSISGSGCATTTDKEKGKGAVSEKKLSDSPSSAASSRAVRVRLPRLPTFAGEENKDDKDTFDRWIRILEKYAELEQWSDREKLLQLELHLKGRAEQLFNILPEESVCDFRTASQQSSKTTGSCPKGSTHVCTGSSNGSRSPRNQSTSTPKTSKRCLIEVTVEGQAWTKNPRTF